MNPTGSYSTRPTTDDPRETESWALMEAAKRLNAAKLNPGDREAMQAALIANQRLWTIFQVAMTDAESGLPEPVRKNVLELSIFVDRQTSARLRDLDASKLDVLININRQLSAGLGAPVDAAAVVAAAQPAAAVAPPPVMRPNPYAAQAQGGGLKLSV